MLINFLKNFSKIKPSIIARENKIDYSNVKRGLAKDSKINLMYKEIKKKIFTILLIEVLSDEEINAIKDVRDEIIERKEYVLDSMDLNNIYIVYKIFGEFIEKE